MKVTIDRSKWRYGGVEHKPSKGVVRLLNKEGYMCCLGFYSLACGYTQNQIKHLVDPEGVVLYNENKYLPKTLETNDDKDSSYELVNSWIVRNLIMLNDDPRLTHEQREKQIREKFAELDVEVEFVGEYDE